MMNDSTIERVARLALPVISDLKLDLYDIEFRGGTLRVTIDTAPGTVRDDGRPGGVDLDTLALASRLIGRELDAADPLPGHYTLEVTSPGLERTLRTPAHFQREVGKQVNVRLRDMGEGEQRRVAGVLIAADDNGATIRLDDAALTERTVSYQHIDRAKTVFVWATEPKPSGPKPAAAGVTVAGAKALATKAGTAKTAAGAAAKKSSSSKPTAAERSKAAAARSRAATAARSAASQEGTPS
jgi:ribosome maturation factor RimP